ncbi:tetratricopeptide repeat protein [Desulfonema magnum]|uniref:Tetratricopeptide repeat-containing protein, DUF560 n=1 Tax=Desulfonema magnum TaxID=45655 RepID=A0A975BSY9_9BACT|nr:tetratricopeptide repeat protein [Desulfonema magnum]QTA91070.1 Tetratricopeptide repeat-containing protein, DUF560 [Desulfonema magnum]
MQKILSFILVAMFILSFGLPAHAQEDRGRAYYDFGVFAYEDGDYESAEKNLKKALEFNPDNPFYNHYLGKIFLKTERYQEAMTYFTKAWKADPDISGLKYDLAFLNYKMSDYSKSSELFKQIVKTDPSNVLAHYYAGITLYKQKHYQAAPDYFINAGEKSLTLRSNAYYHAGICYQMTGKTEKAIEKFEYVRDHSDSESLKQGAVKWLRAIKTGGKDVSPYSIYLKTGRRYDDNVTLDSDKDRDGLDADKHADKDDYVTVGYFSGKYKFVSRKDFQIGAGYRHYQTWYDELDEYNLTVSIFNLYTKYRFDTLGFGFSYIPSYYWVDSESYLRRHRLTPRVTWDVSENFITRVSYSYDKNDYFSQDGSRSGHANEFFWDFYYSLANGKASLFGGLGYEDNSASGSDYCYGQLKTKLAISFNLPWKLNLSLMGKYYDKKYDHTDTVYHVKRDDNKYIGSVSLSRSLFYDWLSIGADFDYTKKDSNISIYEYDKKVTTLSVTATF